MGYRIVGVLESRFRLVLVGWKFSEHEVRGGSMKNSLTNL